MVILLHVRPVNHKNRHFSSNELKLKEEGLVEVCSAAKSGLCLKSVPNSGLCAMVQVFGPHGFFPLPSFLLVFFNQECLNLSERACTLGKPSRWFQSTEKKFIKGVFPLEDVFY